MRELTASFNERNIEKFNLISSAESKLKDKTIILYQDQTSGKEKNFQLTQQDLEITRPLICLVWKIGGEITTRKQGCLPVKAKKSIYSFRTAATKNMEGPPGAPLSCSRKKKT